MSGVVLNALSSFALITLRNRRLVALLQFSSSCQVAVSVLCLFFTVPRIGLQCVIVKFRGQTHLLFIL